MKTLPRKITLSSRTLSRIIILLVSEVVISILATTSMALSGQSGKAAIFLAFGVVCTILAVLAVAYGPRFVAPPVYVLESLPSGQLCHVGHQVINPDGTPADIAS